MNLTPDYVTFWLQIAVIFGALLLVIGLVCAVGLHLIAYFLRKFYLWQTGENKILYYEDDDLFDERIK